LGLAIQDGGPVQFGRGQAFDSVFLRVFQVVPELSVEQQRLSRNAAHVQARAAEVGIFFDQRRLQAVLSGADRGRIASGAAANYGNVINGFRQSRAPLLQMDEIEQTNDSSREG